MKNSIPQLNKVHFKCPLATCGCWLSYWQYKILNISIITGSSVGQHCLFLMSVLKLCGCVCMQYSHNTTLNILVCSFSLFWGLWLTHTHNPYPLLIVGSKWKCESVFRLESSRTLFFQTKSYWEAHWKRDEINCHVWNGTGVLSIPQTWLYKSIVLKTSDIKILKYLLTHCSQR